MNQNELVKEVNRVYHEREAALYDVFHPEIFKRESARWERLERFLPIRARGMTLLDVGSGTGFVPEVLRGHLKAQDTVILTDLSPEMLEKAKAKFRGVRGPAFVFKVADAESLPLGNETVDAVTVNSVLHHVPDTEKFLTEALRILKPGGRLFIAHEPNRTYHASGILRFVARGIGFVQSRLRRLRGHATSASADAYAPIYHAVNAELRKKGLMPSDLSEREIQQLVDVHSPTASGEADATKGFDVDMLLAGPLAGTRLVHRETYAHLGKHEVVGGVLRLLDALLRVLFPAYGSSFSLIVEKPTA